VGRIGSLQSPQCHLVVGRKDGIQFRVGLEEILRHVVGQRPFPVGGLTRHHMDARRGPKAIEKTKPSLIRGFVPRNSLDHGHIAAATKLGGKISTRHHAALEIVRSNIGDRAGTHRIRGFPVDPCIHQEHRDTGLVGFENRRHQLLGSGWREEDRVHPLLDEILDDLVLALDVGLAFGRKRDEVHTLTSRLGFGALLHFRPEWRIQRFWNKGHDQCLVLRRRG